MPERLRIRTPAKVNLYLEILGRRDDGYHNIDTVMQAVTLWDDIELEERRSGLEVICETPGIPLDEENLAARAWLAFRERTGRPRGLKIRITKRIPISAGLGGGSGNAAGVLRGLDEMCGGGEDLETLAARIGSDVPFFLSGGTQRGTGRGTDLTVLPSLPECCILLVCPEIPVSTRWAYEHVKMPLTRAADLITMIQSGLRHGDVSGVARGLFNRFEPVILRTYPVLDSLKSEISRHRALGVVLSGSGPTLAGLFDSREAAFSLHGRLAQRGYRAFVVEPAEKGIEVL